MSNCANNAQRDGPSDLLQDDLMTDDQCKQGYRWSCENTPPVGGAAVVHDHRPAPSAGFLVPPP